ncbi:proline racemase family protein [Brevibacillus sp. NRS-1366]|uniref:proline racemase family protein n=1 Tax=Brevibacillus sp. NRS-1366 TaxID=3233899 RepID=UPI003D198AB1
MRLTNMIHTVDAHAEGEPSRIVVGGVIGIPGRTMFEKKMYLEQNYDELRRFLLFEPRGSVALHADLVLPPTDPRADAGFIIMEATDYPPMSGSNTMCTVTVLLETGMLPLQEPVTHLMLESPAGLIPVEAQCKGGKCERVTFTNAPAFATHLDAKVSVPEIGEITVDVAYGGAFFVFVDAEALGFKIVAEEAAELSRLGELIKRAAAKQLPVVHPENKDIHTISFTTFVAPPRVGGHGRNTTIVSPGRVDRSACGTATSARLAVLAKRGLLKPGKDYVHESILDTNFVGRIVETTTVGPYQAIVPSISGRAWITGVHQLGLDPTDPFRSGFTLSDAWGAGGVSSGLQKYHDLEIK